MKPEKFSLIPPLTDADRECLSRVESPIQAETYAEFCARKDREQAEEDERREVEASQREDYQSWRRQ